MNEAEIRKGSKKKNKAAYTLNKKKTGSPLMKFMIAVTAFFFVLYCTGTIIATQADIAEKKQELAVLAEKAEKLEEANDEYQSILSENDERTFMERYAVEALGYAYPNERRFYDTAGK